MYRQIEDTYLSQAVVTAGSAAAYDVNVKYLLADRQILARILKYTIQECRDMEIEEIISCIGNNIEVASAALDPGLSNLGRVREDKTEDNVPGEGTVFYDIRFSARFGEAKMKFLINLEAQKLTSHSALGYHLENRIVYYMARMVSAQKNIMQVETEGRMKSMCNLSEVFIEKGIRKGMQQGIQQGALYQSRQVILDLLEDLGDIPEDILSAVRQEEDPNTLRKWYKAAARADSMEAFREKTG